MADRIKVEQAGQTVHVTVPPSKKPAHILVQCDEKRIAKPVRHGPDYDHKEIASGKYD